MRFVYTLSPEEFFEGQRVYCRTLARGWVRFNYYSMLPLGVLLLARA